MSVISQLRPWILELGKNKNEFCLTNWHCALSVCPFVCCSAALSTWRVTCFDCFLNGSFVYWKVWILRCFYLWMKFVWLAVHFLNYSWSEECIIRSALHSAEFDVSNHLNCRMVLQFVPSEVPRTFCDSLPQCSVTDWAHSLWLFQQYRQFFVPALYFLHYLLILEFGLFKLKVEFIFNYIIRTLLSAHRPHL
jgi:hypothetical protein